MKKYLFIQVFLFIFFLPILQAQYQGGAGSGYFNVSLDTAFCMTFPDTARGSGYAMDFLPNAFCMTFPDTARGSGYAMNFLPNAFCMTFPDTARGSGYAMDNADSSDCSMFTVGTNINSGYNYGELNNALCNFFSSTTDSGGPYDMEIYSNLNCAPFFSSGSGSGYGAAGDTCLVPLPFLLTELRAEAMPDYNKVYWLISVEESDFYELEHSFNNSDYKVLYRYSLSSEKPISQEEYSDYNFQEKTYYRLKIYYKSGKHQFSRPVLVLRKSPSQSKVSVKVFPNPVKQGQILHIRTSQIVQSIRLYSLTGQFLRETQQTDIIMNFPSGVYFVNIRLSDGKIIHRKILLIE